MIEYCRVFILHYYAKVGIMYITDVDTYCIVELLLNLGRHLTLLLCVVCCVLSTINCYPLIVSSSRNGRRAMLENFYNQSWSPIRPAELAAST